MSETIKKGQGSSDVTTPSGLKIHFESKPKRLYTIAAPQPGDGNTFDYLEPVEVISVTTALDVLYKGGLDWWGMRVGIDGVLELIERGELRLAPGEIDGILRAAVKNPETGVWEYALRPSVVGDEVVNVEAIMKALELRVDKIKDATADRGNNVHDALEMWAMTGELPDPSKFKGEQQGYVTALVAFLNDSRIVPRQSEVLVGSLEHRYAGRFDLECHSPFDTTVVTKVFPRAKPKHVQLPIGIGRLDLKTSKDIYYNTLLQLAGYEGACIESGYGPSDWQGTLNVNKDGRYQIRLNPQDHRRVTPEDYAHVVQMWRIAKKAEEALKV